MFLLQVLHDSSLCCLQVKVVVINHLFSEALTVHWHGLHMVNNMWMDGVPYTTQCLIQPGTTFTYRFIADPIGTHWYHSHLSNQRMDGLSGMLIIHDTEPVMPYFPMSITDWVHTRGDDIRADTPSTGGSGNNLLPFFSNVPTIDAVRFSFANQLDSLFPFYSILVNGRGRHSDSVDPWPLEMFVVNAGDTSRFRVAHTGIESPLRISVDQHHLIIVATDDGDIQPITVESFWIFVAETIDFEIIADQPIDNYWLRIETLGSQRGINSDPDGITYDGKAVLSYGTSGSVTDPTTQPSDCTENAPCHVFNCPFECYPQHYNRSCIDMADARSVEEQESLNLKYGLGQVDPDEEIFLNFNFANGASINAISYRAPRVPFSMSVPDQIVPCDPADCADGCSCTHILELPTNKVVQFVMTNYAPSFSAPLGLHVAHLHGNTFAVLKEGFGPLDAVTGRPVGNNPDVRCTSSECYGTEWANGRPQINLQKPPLKNTISLSTQGYVVVRINTTNSGYWRLHCHLQPHVLRMALLVKVGDPPEPPNNFPQCGNFDFKNDDDFQHYLDKNANKMKGKEAKSPKKKSTKKSKKKSNK